VLSSIEIAMMQTRTKQEPQSEFDPLGRGDLSSTRLSGSEKETLETLNAVPGLEALQVLSDDGERASSLRRRLGSVSSLTSSPRSSGCGSRLFPLPRSSWERNEGMSRGGSFLMCECLASVDWISRNGWLKRASILRAPACDPSRFT
jgi:hypothetical protein